jgi:protein SCO1/2
MNAKASARATRSKRAQRDSRSVGPWVLIGVGIVVVALGLAAMTVAIRARAPQLVGPLVQDSPHAPNFTLKDQNGQSVQMASFQGHVVALTYLYTNCPDICPLIASKMAMGQQRLGNDRDIVELLAVSVDPAHDTPAAARKFSDERHLSAHWHYLVGSTAELLPVWKSYFIGTDAAQLTGTQQTASDLLNHTAIVYLIDKSQRVRVALDSNFSVDDFVQDVHALSRSS